MSTQNTTDAVVAKLGISWFLVGLSQMTPLQWAQFIAAIAATIYTLVQTWKLLFPPKKD